MAPLLAPTPSSSFHATGLHVEENALTGGVPGFQGPAAQMVFLKTLCPSFLTRSLTKTTQRFSPSPPPQGLLLPEFR